MRFVFLAIAIFGVAAAAKSGVDASSYPPAWNVVPEENYEGEELLDLGTGN